MEDKILVFGPNNEIYTCYKSYSGEDEKAKIINDKLKELSILLSQISYSKDISSVHREIYVYESMISNALSKRENDGYMIAISSYLLFDIEEEIESYMYKSDLRDYFYGRKKNAKKHAQMIHNYILKYIVLHENYHILNGHCDAFQSTNYASVKRNTQDLNENFTRQIIEMDADFCAVRSLIYLINEIESYEEREMEVMLVGFALYFIFLQFQCECYEGIKIDINQLDHPPASVRMNYCFAIIMTYLKGDKFKVCLLMERLTNLCIYFDRIYYDSDEIDMALFAYAYTYDGQEYLNKLFNGWSSVKTKLDNTAYIQLREDTSENLSNRYFLNNEGKQLRVIDFDKRFDDFVDAFKTF